MSQRNNLYVLFAGRKRVSKIIEKACKEEVEAEGKLSISHSAHTDELLDVIHLFMPAYLVK